MNIDGERPLWWTADDVLTPGECHAWIARIEAGGPSAAPISTGRGFEMRPDVRNNDRVIIEDREFAEELYRRLTEAIPDAVFGWQRIGLNERLRCYRYQRGQWFAPHSDGAFRRTPDERSFLTVMVYLNEDFEGGHTRFLRLGAEAIPRTGRVLLFQHALLHEGAVVESGVKYALRTDAMFRRLRVADQDREGAAS